MPGRDYNKAYALFEQSLGDTSYPVYPKAHPQDYRLPVSYNVRSKSFAERSRLAYDNAPRPERPSVETHLLPPTPPLGSQSQDPSFGLANRLTTPELTPDTRHGTPFTTLEAPTPNTTSPTLRTPRHFRGASYDSSRAESFQTAKEDVSLKSEGESPIELPLQGVKKPDSDAAARIEVYALGLRNFDRVTERAHRRLLADVDLKRPSKEDVDVQSSVGTEQSSESRPKRRKLDKVPRELTFLEDAGHTPLKSPTNQESPSSWLDGSSTGENSPVGQKQIETEPDHVGRFSTPESKILTPVSTGSPVVEASIVDSPRRHRRQLRHVSKQPELRPSPQSKTQSEASDTHPEPQDSLRVLQEIPDAKNKQPKSERLRSEASFERDVVPPPRSRSMLTSKMHKSLRAKTHSWRRSAPGLMAREGAGAVARNPMGVVPEDSPLPESPRPPSDKVFGDGKAPSQRRNSEHSTIASESVAKAGSDSYLDPGSARNTFTRSSPVSDASEALVGDATTVNIFPHNNDSLIVVEHAGSSGTSQAASKETRSMEQVQEDRDAETGDEMDVTPEKETHKNPATVESPLTNPRRPPDPPAVSIIPPSPAGQEDVGPISTESSQAAPPLERSSFSQRAKRYSDSLTNSVSKLASGNTSAVRSEPKRSSLPHVPSPTRSTSDPHLLGRASDKPRNTLYPTWKPRSVGDDLNNFHRSEDPTLPPPSSAATTTLHDSAGDSSATENIPPSTAHSNSSRSSRRLSVRRLLSIRSPRAPKLADGPSSESSRWTAPLRPQRTSDSSGPLIELGTQRRSLTGSLRQKLHERSLRREEQRHTERQERLRHSIGPRFYVETSGFGGRG